MTLEDRILKTFDKVLENDKTHQWSLPSEKIDYFEKKIMSENLTIIFEKVAITETLKEVDSLKLSDDFHEWHKGILGEDDILNKIIDKIIEKVKEVRK